MGFFDFLNNLGGAGSSGMVSLDLGRRIKSDWDNVEVLLRAGGPAQLKQALITADKDLDNALKEASSGESMAERLKNSKDRFEWSFYQRIWDAHKLRNNLVHEAGFDPQHFVIREAVNTIKTALIKLGVSL